jgi:putative transposase
VDRAALAEVLGIERLTRLAETHAEWIEAALRAGEPARVPEWSESLAVGSREFVERAGRRAGHQGSVSGDRNVP